MRLSLSLLLSVVFVGNAAPSLISAEGADVSIGQHTVVEADRHESIMRWSDFNLGKDESIHFALPSPHSVAVNHIEGGISKISGSFTSNGHVHLLNPAGIVFMPSSSVDVAVLFAKGSMVELGGQLNASYVRVEADALAQVSAKLNTNNMEVYADSDIGLINIDSPISALRISEDNTSIILSAQQININAPLDVSGENIGGELRVAGAVVNVASPMRAQNGFLAVGADNLIEDASIIAAGGYLYKGDADYVFVPPNPLAGTQQAYSEQHFEPLGSGFVEVRDGVHTNYHEGASYSIDMDTFLMFGDAIMKGGLPSSAQSHYYTENGAYENITHYKQLQASDVYPGVDLKIYHNRRGLSEYDLIVTPGSRVESIQIGTSFEPEVIDGNVYLGEHKMERPLAYQECNGVKNIVRSSYKINEGIGFNVAGYDDSLPLVLDPTISNTAYFTGSGFERTHSARLDNNDLVIVKRVDTALFAGVDPGQGYYFSGLGGAPNAMVLAKMDEDYTLQYLTYITATGNIFDQRVAGTSANEIFLLFGLGADVTLNGVGDLSTRNSFAPNNLNDSGGSIGAIMKFANNGQFLNAGYLDVPAQDFTINDMAVDRNDKPVIYGSFLQDGNNIVDSTFFAAPLVDDSNPANTSVEKHFLARFSNDLTSLDGHRILAQEGRNQYNELFISPNNNYAVIGYHNNSVTSPASIGAAPASTQSATQDNVFIAKLDSSFNIIHQHITGSAPSDVDISPGGIVVDENENTYAGFETGNVALQTPNGTSLPGFSQTPNGILIRKFSSTGQLVAETYDGNAAQPFSNDIKRIVARDDSVIGVGFTRGNGPLALKDPVFGYPLAASGDPASERPVFILEYNSALTERRFADVINSNTHNPTFFLYSQSPIESFTLNNNGKIDLILATDMTGLPTTLPNAATHPFFSNVHGGLQFASYYAQFDFGLSNLIPFSQSSASVITLPVIPAGVIRAYVNTKSDIDIFSNTFTFRTSTSEIALNSFLIRNNIRASDVKDIQVSDGDGIWLYERGKWVYKKR